MIGQVHRLRLLAPAHQVRPAIVSRIAGAGQSTHLLLQRLCDSLESQGDQGLNERDSCVESP